jgi:hypothetical protein
MIRSASIRSKWHAALFHQLPAGLTRRHAFSPLQYDDILLQLRKLRERLWSRYAAAIFIRRA